MKLNRRRRRCRGPAAWEHFTDTISSPTVRRPLQQRRPPLSPSVDNRRLILCTTLRIPLLAVLTSINAKPDTNRHGARCCFAFRIASDSPAKVQRKRHSFPRNAISPANRYTKVRRERRADLAIQHVSVAAGLMQIKPRDRWGGSGCEADVNCTATAHG